AENVGGSSAEDHADAELVGAVGDAVGNHAIEAYGGKKQGDHGEDAEKAGYQLLLCVFILPADPAFQIAGAPDDLLLGIHLSNLSTEVVEQGFGRNFGAHQDLREHPHAKCVGNVDAGLDGSAQAVVAGIGDDADDLEIAVSAGSGRRIRGGLSGEVGNANLLADGVARGPILAGQFFVDDGNLGAAHGFGTIPQAALLEWDVKNGEIFGADEVQAGFGLFGARGAVNFEAHGTAVGGRSGVGGDAGFNDLRHGGDVGAKLFVVLTAIPPGHVGVFVNGDGKRHGVMGVIAKVGVDELEEAFAGGTGDSEEQQSEGDLRTDQDAVSALGGGTAGDAAATALHQAHDVRAGELERRRQAEDDRGGKSEADTEEEDRQIDFDDGLGGEQVGKPRNDGGQATPGDQDAQARAGGGDEQSLG